ncbi:MAG: pyrroline-5-carboxylate reductase [Bryobacterales bacterium]|nr:pyrroline-5-carboxylate reductase [Acidobacteriota bacterium]MCB9386165.1 pyrroline-5-carboxylate reductase [Bryobacterales bacterium]
MSLDQTIAVIGAGNLGSALLQGLRKDPENASASLIASDVSEQRLADLAARLPGLETMQDNRAAVEKADIVILAVKPHFISHVVVEISDVLRRDQLLISFAAAVPIRLIEARLDHPQPIIRAMPNIAMTVHAAATGLCGNAHATSAHRALAQSIFATVGEAVFVDEAQMHAVTGLSGSGPAYVFTMIEALAAGGVRMGLTPASATKLAAQTLLGAAKMVIEGGQHPAVLRDQVTTPGGTTIAGLQEIELGAVRGALMNTVQAATERSVELAQMLEGDDES